MANQSYLEEIVVKHSVLFRHHLVMSICLLLVAILSSSTILVSSSDILLTQPLTKDHLKDLVLFGIFLFSIFVLPRHIDKYIQLSKCIKDPSQHKIWRDLEKYGQFGDTATLISQIQSEIVEIQPLEEALSQLRLLITKRWLIAPEKATIMHLTDVNVKSRVRDHKARLKLYTITTGRTLDLEPCPELDAAALILMIKDRAHWFHTEYPKDYDPHVYTLKCARERLKPIAFPETHSDDSSNKSHSRNSRSTPYLPPSNPPHDLDRSSPVPYSSSITNVLKSLVSLFPEQLVAHEQGALTHASLTPPHLSLDHLPGFSYTSLSSGSALNSSSSDPFPFSGEQSTREPLRQRVFAESETDMCVDSTLDDIKQYIQSMEEKAVTEVEEKDISVEQNK